MLQTEDFSVDELEILERSDCIRRYQRQYIFDQMLDLISFKLRQDFRSVERIRLKRRSDSYRRTLLRLYFYKPGTFAF
jgi:hypothetical protein